MIGLSLAGCTQLKQLQHLDPLLTLKDFSDEREGQAQWVEEKTKKFEELLAAVQEGSISKTETKESLSERFEQPIVIDHVNDQGYPVERWLYRHPIQKLAADRVYFYFNADGRFLRFERVPPAEKNP